MYTGIKLNWGPEVQDH